MRVVITGATGNLGTSLVEELINDPDVDEMIGIARRPVSLQIPKMQWRTADIATDDLSQHFEGANAVVHLAWELRPSHHLQRLHDVNVNGSNRVFHAAIEAGVKTVIHMSSVGVYSPGPKTPVDESHPAGGVSTSTYGLHKAAVERQVDLLERAHPDIRWVRMRPGLIFKRDSAEHVRRLFFGSLYPIALLRRRPLPALPNVPGLIVNVVHAADVAAAIRLALNSNVRGAFNVAADNALDIPAMAKIAGVPAVPLPAGVLRAGATLTWRAHLQPTEAGWIDLALQTPLLDSTRAKSELGWSAKVSAEDAFAELIDGLKHAGDTKTPPLISARRVDLRTAVNNGKTLLQGRLR